ncbi:type VI secretion system baseplate subunit TssK [Pseudomonas aeruginosa]
MPSNCLSRPASTASWSRALHDHKLLGSASFVLAASASCESEEAAPARCRAHLKVGAVEHIRQLVNLHPPRDPVKPLPVAPRQIPFHPTRPISFSNPTPRTWPGWSAPAVSRSTYPAGCRA